MLPRIGITSSFEDWPDDAKTRERLCNYACALDDAGAGSEFLFLGQHAPEDAENLASQLDGLLLSGGNDLHPGWYGEAPREGANLTLVPSERPLLEKALCDAFAARRKPIFGICYGCQFLNVWAGGGLVQDIPLQWPGYIPHKESRHLVRVAPNSLLARITEMSEFEVNSFHHQGIGAVAPDAHAVAQASDGIIEALELKDSFICGAQWHPERDRADEITQRLFSAFVAACR
jgi:putative glutamine amidotransferase